MSDAFHIPTHTADPRHLALQRMQRLALLLLLAAVAGLALSHAMGGQKGWGWLLSFCEAAAIGALADWFAVVALFRRPLGLPVPHTAVIPANQARIADSLADFVRHHFLDPDTLMAKLAALDPASHLSDWLRDPARLDEWMSQASRWALGTLNALDDERLQNAVLQQVITKVRQWDAASTTGEVLGMLTQNGRHHELLDVGLRKAAEWLQRDDVKAVVAAHLLKHVRQEWPLMAGMVNRISSTSDMAQSFAEKLSLSALGELQEVLAKPRHPLRQRYEHWLANTQERLQHDPAIGQAVNDLKNRQLDDPLVRRYAATLWADIKALLQTDLASPDSAIAMHLRTALQGFGEQMASDTDLRASINQHLLAAAHDVVDKLRGGITHHIAQTVKSWDSEQLAHELELSVGKDLQYIRISGTLVGGLAGLVIHAVLLWMA
ncbi:MAG: DUF445 domain-containing protein [Polaromonas sp.]|nr:DUF445 domain-containing protein [Polaromonas sp.]